MKTEVVLILLFTLTITACQKQPEQPMAAESSNEPTVTAEFDQANKKITDFLDQLDHPNTSQERRTQIICKDYPAVYKNEYIPALLKLSPNEYTEPKLLQDMKIALNYYVQKDKVICNE
ncbi:hypothetical protein [Acinetobacter radioresistens]|uniref:hypothetical protein n=1 Tax=Acinetobacter radioresistens TaxID=40216 RepID=UPI002003A031|nr:hypothetical protein [Acinetobacter radioresistens]MCK4100790.1 hypothetical protein [Acinetobacter radioresistens]